MKETSSNSLHWADGLLLLVALFWGGNFAAVKFGLAEIPPIVFNAVRYVLAAIVLLIAVYVGGQTLRVQRQHLLYIVLIGVLGNTGYPLLFVYGVDATSADNAALIMAAIPVWVALLGTAVGMEKLNPRGWIGVTLSVAGILLVILGSRQQVELEFGGASIRGDLIILAAALSWAIYTLALRPLTKIYESTAISTLGMVVGIVPMTLLALPSIVQLDWWAVSWGAWASLLITGVFAVGLAYIFWGYGVTHLGSTRTSLYLNVVPPIALFINWLWLGETLTMLQWAGTIVALAGVGLARRHTRQLPNGLLDRWVSNS